VARHLQVFTSLHSLTNQNNLILNPWLYLRSIHHSSTLLNFNSLPVDMLLSAVSVLVDAQSSSEIPEGLMNNPVFIRYIDQIYRVFSQNKAPHCYTQLPHSLQISNRRAAKRTYFLVNTTLNSS
jgi:hypothetical protein